MDTIIRTEKLCKNYSIANQEISILKSIDLSVKTGEFLSIMGPSGCGKSTLLYLLGGIEKTTSGKVFIDEEDINKMGDNKRSKIRRKELAFVFQFFNLVQNLTVSENILLPLAIDRRKVKNYQQNLEEILELVGLSEWKDHTPRQLSGGQQQRVAIARALIINPSVILADEPTGNLDTKSTKIIMDIFQKINKEKGITILQVTHSPETAEYSNRIIEMKDGRIHADIRVSKTG